MKVKLGQYTCIVNDKLIEKQSVQNKVEMLTYLHRMRMFIEHLMANTNCKKCLYKYNEMWIDTQFALQETWGFEKDAKYHKFWTVPNCKCPKLDNEDYYGTRYSVRNTKCPIHGVDKDDKV